MRILHVLDHSIPLHSGYTFRTRSILREQRRLGWETFHLTSPKQTGCTVDEETVDGLHFYRTSDMALADKPPGWREWSMMRRLERRLEVVARTVQPDIIHAHSPVLNAMPAVTVGAKLGIPVVYEVRAFWEDAAVDHGTTHEGSLRYRLTRAYETRAFRRVAHVFTICEGLRRDIVERGVASSKITVIPNAVDIEAFEPGAKPDADLKAQLGLTNADVVGFIGSFYAYEGLDLLLKSFPAVLSARSNVRLLLVGGGPQERELRALAESLGVADKVVFTGRVPHAEVQRYYDLIDVLAYPRHRMRLTELVTPLKPLEAMAQGRLLIASDVGGHQELIADEVNGRLFAAGDANALSQTIIDTFSQRGAWGLWQAAGRRYVETERNWSSSVKRYAASYRSVLSQTKSVASRRA